MNEYKTCPVCKKQRSTKVFEDGICVVCVMRKRPEYKPNYKEGKWDED